MMCSYCLSPLTHLPTMDFWVSAGGLSCSDSPEFMRIHRPVADEEVVAKCTLMLTMTLDGLRSPSPRS